MLLQAGGGGKKSIKKGKKLNLLTQATLGWAQSEVGLWLFRSAVLGSHFERIWIYEKIEHENGLKVEPSI